MEEDYTHDHSPYAPSGGSYAEDAEFEYEYIDQAIPLVSFNPTSNTYELQDNALRFI